MGPQKKKRSSAQPMKICLETPLIIFLSWRIDIQSFEGVTVVRGPASVTRSKEEKTPGNFISLPPTKAIRRGIIVAIGAANSLAMPEKRGNRGAGQRGGYHSKEGHSQPCPENAPAPK